MAIFMVKPFRTFSNVSPHRAYKKQEDLYVVRTLVCDSIQSLCDSTHTEVRTTFRKHFLSGLWAKPTLAMNEELP